ncbi:MAG: 50S ribosomal protein L1, partial [Erythrobacter sp.]|nr:50S ribosomal protein L1 [Erythrobacter sp.]MDZ4271707.1 50S ribosomal protein L1 [Erythrobacter sp.]
MTKITKKAKVLASLDREKLYSVDEALSVLRQYKTKFDETV